MKDIKIDIKNLTGMLNIKTEYMKVSSDKVKKLFTDNIIKAIEEIEIKKD